MLLLDSPHQRRRIPLRFSQIRVDACCEKYFDRGGIPIARRQHECRLAVRPALFCVSSRLQQSADHGRIAIEGGHVQRGDALTGHHVHLCPGAYQQIRNFEVIPIHGPMERCRAIDLCGVHVGFLLNECFKRGSITLHCCVRDIRAARREVAAGHTDEENGDGEKRRAANCLVH